MKAEKKIKMDETAPVSDPLTEFLQIPSDFADQFYSSVVCIDTE